MASDYQALVAPGISSRSSKVRCFTPRNCGRITCNVLEGADHGGDEIAIVACQQVRTTMAWPFARVILVPPHDPPRPTAQRQPNSSRYKRLLTNEKAPPIKAGQVGGIMGY
jgi:hypothetical protein